MESAELAAEEHAHPRHAELERQRTKLSAMRAYQHTQHSYLMALVGGLMIVWMVISAIIFEVG